MSERFVIMGAGEVGFYLARTLSEEGNDVVVIESNPERSERVQEAIDGTVIVGNGAHVPVLEAGSVKDCDLFMAVSSSDEANLVASQLAKQLGARRTVVRVGNAEDLMTHRSLYEKHFAVDLLLSTQLVATNRILNYLLGHNTLAVEYLAHGKLQLRRIHLEEGSILTRIPLSDVKMPPDSLVVAFFRGEKLIVPGGQDLAQPGDDVLVLCKREVIDQAERTLSSRPRTLGSTIIVGGGATAYTVARALSGHVDRIKLIERERSRAEQLATQFPKLEVLQGDGTDPALLRAERVAGARAFVALTGHDERNLMACLLAQDLGVPNVVALVQRTETSHLWNKLGKMNVVSPRPIFAERIRQYVESGYTSNVVALRRGEAQVIERRLAAASPAAGVTLADIKPPKGMIVGAVVRGDRVFVPRGKDRLETGDHVVLFVAEEHVPTVQLLFPGGDSTAPPRSQS